MNRFFAFLILVSLSNTGFGQVTAELSATPQLIGKDGYFNLRISISGADNILEFIPPPLDKFVVLSGPMHEQSVTTLNGKSTRSTGISFVLKPKSTGKFTVGPAKIKLPDGYIQTNKITITVSNNPVASQPQMPGISLFDFDPFEEPKPKPSYPETVLRKGEDINKIINQNMFLRLETSKTTCFVGEPVVAEYKLYSRLKSDSRLTRTPSFNGFSVVDISSPAQGDYQKEKLNGRDYNVYSIRKAQLYPLQEGSFTLDPAELDNHIQFVKEDYLKQLQSGDQFLGNLSGTLPPDAYINQQILLRSKPVTITVKPLPTVNKPSEFKGAVGRFTINANMERDTIGINETGKLMVTIGGEGNFQLLTAPAVQWPVGTEAFDPNVKDAISNNSVPLSGSKIFSFGFSVDREGEFIIPPIVFSYFDPGKAAYQTIRSAPVHLFVGKAVANPVSEIPIVTHNKPGGINQIFYHRWWIIAALAVLALSGLFFWVRKETQKKERENPKTQIPEPENIAPVISTPPDYLKNSKEHLAANSGSTFYPILLGEFKHFLSEKFSLQQWEINPRKIASGLSKKGIPEEQITKTTSLLKEIEGLVYMPFDDNDKPKEIFDRTLQQIETLNGL